MYSSTSMPYIGQNQIVDVPNWDWQLAGLVRTVWSTDDGEFLFPYPPLGKAAYWQKEIAAKWRNGTMLSWAMVKDGVIRAHASLINKGDYWELGRFVSYDDNPPLTMTILCFMAMSKANENGWPVICEATQRHTSSQYICNQLGLRFAGFGMLTQIGSVFWDILYFDNLKAPAFSGKQGIIGEPLGKPLVCDLASEKRLKTICDILSTERESGFPPKKFHTLPELLPAIEEIIRLNTNNGNHPPNVKITVATGDKKHTTYENWQLFGC